MSAFRFSAPVPARPEAIPPERSRWVAEARRQPMVAAVAHSERMRSAQAPERDRLAPPG